MTAETARGLAVRPGAEAALSGARAVLLCASGGRAHWEAIAPAERQDRFAIERAGRRSIENALVHLDPSSRLLDRTATHVFDLRRLAEAAGFGVLSPYLGLVIHPEFGPWVSLRGVVATALDVPISVPLEAYDPCGPCSRPCLTTCPAGAYRPGHGFDFVRCARHRLAEIPLADHCADACHARRACVVGTEHAYGAAEQQHRHRASLPDVAALLRSMIGR